MAPSPVSSNPIMRNVLIWSAVVCSVVLVAFAVVGQIMYGTDGLYSGLLGGAIGFLFPALTAGSILFANRWFGRDSYPVVFFGVFMGVFLVKIVVFIVALNLLFGLDWIARGILYGALVGTAVASLVVDVAVIARMRVPAVTDVAMPGDADEDDRPDGGKVSNR